LAGAVRPDEVAMLQRLAGNRATAALLAAPQRDALHQPLPVQRNGRGRKGGSKQNKRRERARARQQQAASVAPTTTTAAPTQSGGSASSWSLGGLLSAAWGALGLASEAEGDKHLAGDEEDEEEQRLFNMPKIVIDLGEIEGESALTRFGGKKKASASGKLKGDSKGIEGSGGIEAEVGFDKSKELGVLDYTLAGGQLVGKGEVKAFFGAHGGAEVEASASGEGVAAKGKISAFAGVATEGETEFTIKGGGRELAHFKGALGLTVGAGGELAGHISYTGGNFRFGSKGKVAAGLGFNWEYEMHCSVAPLGEGLWGFLRSLGAAAHEFLTDEDGEPIHL
jgi:hypothetical protein